MTWCSVSTALRFVALGGAASTHLRSAISEPDGVGVISDSVFNAVILLVVSDETVVAVRAIIFDVAVNADAGLGNSEGVTLLARKVNFNVHFRTSIFPGGIALHNI